MNFYQIFLKNKLDSFNKVFKNLSRKKILIYLSKIPPHLSDNLKEILDLKIKHNNVIFYKYERTFKSQIIKTKHDG